VVDKQRHHLSVTGFTGDEDGRTTRRLTANVGVGAALEQQTNHRDVTVRYGAVKSRNTLPIQPPTIAHVADIMSWRRKHLKRQVFLGFSSYLTSGTFSDTGLCVVITV